MYFWSNEFKTTVGRKSITLWIVLWPPTVFLRFHSREGDEIRRRGVYFTEKTLKSRTICWRGNHPSRECFVGVILRSRRVHHQRWDLETLWGVERLNGQNSLHCRKMRHLKTQAEPRNTECLESCWNSKPRFRFDRGLWWFDKV